MAEPRTILVVDDEPDLLHAVRLYLEMEGYQVLAATNGEEALDKLRTKLPDLVVLDVMMPGMTGFDTR
jgi:DNA-binding response OmpR family regulator